MANITSSITVLGNIISPDYVQVYYAKLPSSQKSNPSNSILSNNTVNNTNYRSFTSKTADSPPSKSRLDNDITASILFIKTNKIIGWG